MKIKDCLENGAGICRNEELIEELLAACKAVAAAWRVSDGFDAGDCRLCGAYVYPESGHFTDCPIPAIDAAIAAAEGTP